MTEENKRGAVRQKPDPMALQTGGRITTYEALEMRSSGIKIGPRANGSMKAVIRPKGNRIVMRR